MPQSRIRILGRFAMGFVPWFAAMPLLAQQEQWTIRGHLQFERFGAGIANWIDEDGDGVEDLIVGAPQAPSSLEAAHVRIVSGLDLSTLHELSSDNEVHEGFGEQVAAVGDIDADGTPDFAVGAPVAEYVRIYSGATRAQLHQWTSPQPISGFGASISGIGDLNNDGHADVAVGAPDESVAGVSVGAVRLLSGLDGSLLLRIAGATSQGRLGDRDLLAAIADQDGDGHLDLALLDWKLSGGILRRHARIVSTATGLDVQTITFDYSDYVDYVPVSISTAGDSDGDGRADLAIGALPIDPAADPGRAFVFSTAAGGELLRLDVGDDPTWVIVAGAGDADADGKPDLAVAVDDIRFNKHYPSVVIHRGSDGAQIGRIVGPIGSEFGRAFAAGSDFDGDGVRDVAIGDASFVSNGEARGAVELDAWPVGTQLVRRIGEVVIENFIGRAAELGDVDGDGHVDLVAASVGALFGTHGIRIVSGLDGSQLANFAVTDPPDGPVIALPDIDGDGIADLAIAEKLLGKTPAVELRSGATGAVIRVFVASSHLSQFGFALAVGTQPSGAVHLAIGAPTSSAGASGAGSADVYDVATGNLIFAMNGTRVFEQLGRSIAYLGDVNGDGTGDWAIGSPKNSGAGTDAGRVLVVSGVNGASIKRLVGATRDEFGDGVASPGDLDGDGVGDLMVVAAGFDQHRGELRAFTSAGWSQRFAISGEAQGDDFGAQLGVLPDLNGDGLAEWAVRGSKPQRVDVRSGSGHLLARIPVTPQSVLAAPAGAGGGAGGSPSGDAFADLFVTDPFVAGTEALLIALDDLSLQIDPPVAFANDTVTAYLRGGSFGNVVGLQLLEVNGVPFGAMIGVGLFDVFGEWSLVDVVPPGFAGFTYTLRGYAVGWNGRIVTSLDQLLEFQ